MRWRARSGSSTTRRGARRHAFACPPPPHGCPLLRPGEALPAWQPSVNCRGRLPSLKPPLTTPPFACVPRLKVEKAGLVVGIRAMADKTYDMDELEARGWRRGQWGCCVWGVGRGAWQFLLLLSGVCERVKGGALGPGVAAVAVAAVIARASTSLRQWTSSRRAAGGWGVLRRAAVRARVCTWACSLLWWGWWAVASA